MPTVSMRDLARRASEVVEDVVRSGRPALVTRRGHPVAAVVPIAEDELEDWILAHAPEFVEGRRQADEELAHGQTASLERFKETLDTAESEPR